MILEKTQKNVILAGIFGNALEWYDFTVYAFFVPVLANLFFPTQDAFVSLVQTFGVFAIGFLVRPFGAVLFGYLGDHIGRRKALILSIVMMSLPTFLLGLLPDYHAIGAAAPICLTILRIVQGLAVSGELTTATSFLVEHAPSNQRGFAGSLAMCSAFVGIVVSAAVASFVTELVTDQQLYSWGWRVPFLFGGVIGLIGLMIRLKTIDPVLYQELQNEKETLQRPSVWAHLASLNYYDVFLGILLTAIMAIGNYCLIAYFNTFLVKTQGLPLRSVMVINFICLSVVTVLMPIAGILSDKIGRKPVMTLGVVGFIVFATPIFWLMTRAQLEYVFLGELIFAIILAPIAGVIPVTLAELFDTYNRNTGLAMSYNLSLAFFGGTTPLIAIYLVAVSESIYAPAWYIMIFASISLFILSIISESYRRPL